MQSSETSNPYDALVAASPVVEEQPSAAVALAPLGLALVILLLAGAVVWRKRAALAPGPLARKAGGVLLALLTIVWFLWFTGNLNDTEAQAYAVGLPLAGIGLLAAWKLTRQ